MFRTSVRVVFLLFAMAVPAFGVPPDTLAYQGRLATAAGLPVTGNLSITFRLFDVTTGGSPLWTETQPAVGVDGGNFAVELGTVVPLPTAIWGRKLYLGVQVAGDAEMSPRPALSAAPYALQAGGTMTNTVVVSARGTPVENGTALLGALTRLGPASAQNPMALELDAGVFDLGSQRLDLPAFVTIAGAGREATVITSSSSQGTLLLASNAHARRLTARNTGISDDEFGATFGIGAGGFPTPAPVQNVSLEEVTGEAVAAPGTLAARHGIYLCANGARVIDSIGRGEGGNFSFGMRNDCGNNASGDNVLIDGLTLYSSGGAEGVRGLYIGGGGSWNNVRVFVEANATADTVFGVRVWASAINAGALFSNLLVNIEGDPAASTISSVVEAVRVESADIDFKGLVVSMEDVEATNVVGLRVNAIPPGPAPLHVVAVTDAVISVSGLQRASAGFGGVYGVRAFNSALQLSLAKINVSCLPGGANICTGVRRESQAAGLQPGYFLIDHSSIVVGHVDPLDAGTAQSRGYEGEGQARITNSSLRVLRSPDGESHAGLLLLGAAAEVSVQNSSVEVLSTATPTADCWIGGDGGSLQLMGSHVRGGICTSAVSLTCAGNTKQGTGFLASGCQ